MHAANGGNHVRDQFISAGAFNALFFHCLKLPYFADCRMRAVDGQKSSSSAHAETAKGIVADFPAARLAYRLPNFFGICHRHRHNNLSHISNYTVSFIPRPRFAMSLRLLPGSHGLMALRLIRHYLLKNFPTVSE